MRKLIYTGLVAATLACSQPIFAPAGVSLGAAGGTTLRDGKMEDGHGLVYLRLGLPLIPYGARGDFLVYDDPGGYDMALIGSVIMSLNTPLIQPYAIAGYGRYGMRSEDANGISFGAGLRIGGRRGLFVEGRRHDPMNKTMVSLGLSF
jgi:hypothetical protein